MQLDEVLAELENLGTAQNRKIYARHGIAEPMFGVSAANIAALKRRIKRDQQLADKLWDTRIHDAQVLAVAIADPAAFDEPLFERWVSTANSYAAVDPLAKEVVIRTPFAAALALHWIASDDVIAQRAGWSTIGCLAIWVASIPDQWFEDLLPLIERGIHAAPNRTKEAMNQALIAIGSRNDALRGPAVEVAARIGKVSVDHGETNCKTPDAIPYIEKALAYRTARAAR